MKLLPPLSLIFARAFWTALVLFLCSLADQSQAAPAIRNLSLRGLQSGATTTVTIDGEGLAGDLALLGIPGASVKVRDGATAAKAIVEVTIDAKTPAGVYQLRVVTAEGVSPATVVAVDSLPQVPVAPQAAKLPVAMHGSVVGSARVQTTFAGKAGQEVLIEVEAQRLGSKLRPVLHLINSRGVQVTWGWPSPALSGDARLEVKLPADDKYTVELHDTLYAAATGSFFRLKIGQWQYADLVFPAAVQQGKKSPVELIGNVPPGSPVEITAADADLPVPAPWPASAVQASGIRPAVLVSAGPELLEISSPKTPMSLPGVPVAVNGQLSAAGEEDVYQLAVTPGAKLGCELWAERIGSPMDGVLEIRSDKGVRVAGGDDSPGTSDPRVEYTVPDKVASIAIAVKDLHGRGGARCVYRLAIEEVPAEAPPQLRASVTSDRVNVAQDGRAVIQVLAERTGYSGPIKLAFDKLPAGWKVDGGEIPAGTDGALVLLTPPPKGAPAALASLRATAADPKVKLSQLARVEGHPLARTQPWLQYELAVATSSAAGLDAAWDAPAAGARLVLGGKLSAAVKVKRPAENKGPVRLELVTSQNPPKQNGNPIAARTLRLEKAVELAGDADQGTIEILVPVDLPTAVYNLAVRAELLSADKKTVLATTYTPLWGVAAESPIAIQLAGSEKISAAPNQTLKISGNLTRREDFASDVTVTLTGLPTGVKAPTAVLKKDQPEFTLELPLPAAATSAQYKNVSVSASSPPDPKQATVLVESNVVPLAIEIVAPGK